MRDQPVMPPSPAMAMTMELFPGGIPVIEMYFGIALPQQMFPMRNSSMLKLASLAVIGLSLVFGAVPSAAQERSAAGDWQVSCNTRLYCIASTPGRSEGGDNMQFKLERSNKVGARIYVTVGPEITLGRGMRVEIDVPDLDYGVFGDVTKLYQDNEMAFAGSARRALIGNLRAGRQGRVTVKFGGDAGTVVYDVSLSGVTEALLFMDRSQDRIGRTDAAIAWGSRTPPAEPAKIAAPVARADPEPAGQWSDIVYKTADLPASVAKLGNDDFDCDLEDTLQAYGAHVFGFSDGLRINLVPCRFGDVNIEHFVALTGGRFGDNARAYGFETPPDFNLPDDQTIINPVFEQDGMIITSVSYSSPNRDCGVFRKYRFRAESNFFELREYREKIDCDGQPTLPEDYPMVWTIDEMGQ